MTREPVSHVKALVVLYSITFDLSSEIPIVFVKILRENRKFCVIKVFDTQYIVFRLENIIYRRQGSYLNSIFEKSKSSLGVTDKHFAIHANS